MTRRIVTFSLTYTPVTPRGGYAYHHDLYIDPELDDPAEYLESEAHLLLTELVHDMDKEVGKYVCEFIVGTDTYRQSLVY